MIDYYNLLGIDPAASQEQIRSAFRRKAKQTHPDSQPHLSGVEKERLQRRFIQLAQAYQTLASPEERRGYDRKLAAFRATASARPAAARAGAAPGGPGEPAWRPEADRDGGEPGLEELVRDVEQLLRQFGLDLRQPVEVLLEKLLEWAKSLFREVVEAWEEGSAPTGSQATHHAEKPSADRRADPPPGRGDQSRGAATDRAVEEELQRLKRASGANPRSSPRRGPRGG